MIVHRRRSEEKQFGYRRDGREASPYLVAHRRIIDVIRIMYPRTTGERGGRGGGRKQERAMRTYTRLYIEGRCVYKGNGNDAVTKRSLRTGASLSFSLPLFPTFDIAGHVSTRCTAKPMYCVLFFFRFFFLRSSAKRVQVSSKRFAIICKEKRKKETQASVEKWNDL